jgi:hypothetical protein
MINSRLEEGKIIVIFSRADTGAAITYIRDRFTALVNAPHKLREADRTNSDLINMEKDFQLSGAVQEAKSVTQSKPTDYIITCALTTAGTRCWIQIEAIDYETRIKEVSFQRDVLWDSTVNSLLDRSGGAQLWWERNVGDETWKSNPLMLGADLAISFPSFEDAGGLLPSYTNKGYTGAGSFEGSIHIAYSIWDFLAIQAGLVFAADSFEVFNQNTGHYLTTLSYSSLQIPITIRFNYRPAFFMIDAYAGIYFGIPTGQMRMSDNSTRNYSAKFKLPLGLALGGGGGVKIGPGLIYLDLRYMADLGPVTAAHNGLESSVDTEIGTRQKLTISLGYEISLSL